MKCPKCKSKNTRVSSVDPHPLEDLTKRYCRCLDCAERFTTIEKYLNTAHNPGRKKDSFVLNDYQCEMIAYNDLNLSHIQWAEVYNVSPSTITNAKKRIKRF
tara:strand:+ start:208 stop:513 length:306 start_codon:yes stop_codon:yes gene_type:complete